MKSKKKKVCDILYMKRRQEGAGAEGRRKYAGWPYGEKRSSVEGAQHGELNPRFPSKIHEEETYVLLRLAAHHTPSVILFTGMNRISAR